MVRMKSKKWTSLRTGARIVDAPGARMCVCVRARARVVEDCMAYHDLWQPGARDDNRARDGVVRQYLRDAEVIQLVISADDLI